MMSMMTTTESRKHWFNFTALLFVLASAFIAFQKNSTLLVCRQLLTGVDDFYSAACRCWKFTLADREPSSAGLLRGHSCRLETKAWSSQTIVAQNGGDRPASTESWPGDGITTRPGQSGMAATRATNHSHGHGHEFRGNGNVDHDKLLKER